MYDHHVKAGNPGDVVKHIGLISAAAALLQNRTGIFRYADIFAGYAFNPLVPGGEWQNGIGVVHDLITVPCNPVIQFWRDVLGHARVLEGSLYPGSSIFIRELCMRQGVSFNLRLWDISQAVITDLRRAYQGQDVEIFNRAANPVDFPNKETDLLLIDPPGYQERVPYLGHLLRFFDVVDNVILWLPVTTENGAETVASLESYQECCRRGLSVITVIWGGERSTRGCRMVFRLSDVAGKALDAAVDEVAALAQWQVRHDIQTPC